MSHPQREVLVELGDHGIDDGGWDEADEEGGEYAVLEVSNRIAQPVEGQAIEDTPSKHWSQYILFLVAAMRE